MNRDYQRKNRNFFINKDLQGKMILSIFVAVLGSCLVFILLFGLFSADTMTIIYSDNSLQMGQTPIMLLKKAIAANWVFLIIGGTLLVILAMIGTHRIAGPLFRFEKALDNMERGNLNDTIHLRSKDEGKDLAHKINNFNKLLSEKILDINKHSMAVNDLINQLQVNETAKTNPEEIELICQAIQRNNNKIREIGEFFILTDE
jgi:methyl-accepting chemotaxis protein